MNCDVIRDLLPSYADGICSPASQTLVQEHLAQCPACQKALEQMRQPRRVPATPRAKNPLRLLRRRQIIALLLAIVLTAAVVVTAYQVVLNVDAVHSLFFPIQWGRVENATDWTPVQFETGEFLVLDSGFFRCQDGVFTVVLGARVDQLSHFANVLADIDYAGGSFTLRNLRVEPTMGV